MYTETITGMVIHGKAIGRTIGFPTANITLPSHETVLESGTYGLSGEIHEKMYYGIGVYRKDINLFEAHFFDFSDDIYDEVISVTPLWKIRENQTFSDLENLRIQIEEDKKAMEKWIENENLK